MNLASTDVRMTQTILVAVDGTEESEASLAYVESLAKAWDAEVVLVEAVPDAPTTMTHGDAPTSDRRHALLEREELASGYVADLAADLRDRGIDASGEVARGDVTEVLLEQASQRGANLVALATWGRTGIARLLGGSVAEDLLERPSPTLLVVHASGDQRRSTATIAHILVPIDATEASLVAIPTAALFAHTFGAPVTIVHFASNYATSVDMRASMHRLSVARRRLSDLGIEARTDLRKGDPVRGITEFGLDERAHLPADLIVMAPRPKRGVMGRLKAGVTARVIRNSVAPVVIVPRAA